MKTITIDDCVAGMTLAHDVRSDSGQVLIPKGVSLNSDNIRSLRNRGVRKVVIEDEADMGPSAFSQEEVEKAKEMYYDVVAERFLKPPSDEMAEALFQAALEQTARRVLSGK
ncbi:MAG TPA: hypothetical protein VK435_04725 [Thermodesulfovibrionales bacterium]|nr:hypothetical protein [Thermodesulfovibrionales bacterium]